MNKNIFRYSLGMMIFLSACAIRSYALQSFSGTANIQIDSVKISANAFTELARKDIFERVKKEAEREQLLNKLSNQPSDFPEVFPNAKEEYLWNERAKAREDQDDYERHLSERNQSAAKQ